MQDRYIDLDELMIYGPEAVRGIRAQALGRIVAFDAALTYTANALEEATQAVAEALDTARSTDARMRKDVRRKRPALAAGRRLLARFSQHLSSHEAGTIDRRRFFIVDGRARSVGRSAAKVMQALEHVASELGKEGTRVRDAALWQSEITQVAATLQPPLEGTEDARADRKLQTGILAERRAAWLEVYLAAQSLVESVLRLSGQLGLLGLIFMDKAVPARRRKDTASKT